MMHTQRPKKSVPQDWHRADIKAALEKQGWSMRQLALHHGYCQHYFGAVFLRKHFQAQKLIAEAIGVQPWEIWPSRYTADGTPIRKNIWLPIERPSHWGKNPVRQPENRVTEDTALGGVRNVNVGAAE